MDETKEPKKETYPLITIGVSAYNRRDLLPLSLDSLLAQTYPNCEIIVVDDGSSDGTGELVRKKYPAVRYVYQENAGDAAAKNHAAHLAKGKYIVFNDSDDLFLPDTVERLYRALAGRENACAYGTYQTIDSQGNFLPTKRKVKEYPSGNILPVLLRHIVVNNCATLIPLPLFFEGGAFREDLRNSYDYALFLQLAEKYEFFALEEPAFLRRRHDNNLSAACYEKMLVTFHVFDDFVKTHPRSAEKYRKIVKKRYADFHNKLCREALKEKRKEEAIFHAKASFKASPSLKSLLKMAKGYFL